MGKISYDDKLRKRTTVHQTHQTSLNPLDYHVWCVMLQAFHKLQSKAQTIPELKSALQHICDDLPQTTINKAINDFRKRLNACISAEGGHLSISCEVGGCA